MKVMTMTIKKNELPGSSLNEMTSSLPKFLQFFCNVLKEFWYFLILHVLAVKWLLIELVTKHRTLNLEGMMTLLSQTDQLCDHKCEFFAHNRA